jgi:hypothetical protein
MKASDLYFMRDQDDKSAGFFLVKKEYWKKNKHIDDHEFGKEIWDVLPHWQGGKTKGFEETAEGYFKYYEGLKERNNKGLEIICSLGIQEVLWGQLNPLPESCKKVDDELTLLEDALDVLEFCNHPDFGKPTELMERIRKYLEIEYD